MISVRRALAGLALALVLLPLSIIGASAQTNSTTGTFRVVRQSDWVAPDGVFTLDLTATGFPATTNWTSTVWAPLGSRTQLDRALTGTIPTYQLWNSPSRPLAGTAVSVSIPVSAKWPAPTDGVVLSNEGVYPVVVTATDANGRTIGSVTTFLLRLGAPDSPTPPLSVAPVVTFGATPTVALDGSTSFDDTTVDSAVERLSLVGTSAASTSIVPDGALIAVVTEASEATRNVASTTHELLGAPWVELDTGSLTNDGLTALWNRELLRGDTVLTQAFETAPDRGVQPIDRRTSPAALSHLVATGTRTVIVPSGMLDRLEVPSSTITRGFALKAADGTAVDAIATDDATVRRLLAPADPVLAAHEALAQLVMLHVEQPTAQRGVAIVLPRELDPTALRELLRALGDPAGGTTARPLLTSTTASRLAATIQPMTTNGVRTTIPWTADEPGSLGDYAARLATTDRSLNGLHAMVPEDSEVTGPIDDQVLSSAAAGLDAATRTTVLVGADRAIVTAARGVGLPPSQTMTLTSRTGRIPLNLRNDFAVDARVRVRLVSPKLDFPDGSIIDTTLSPSGITRIDVQVATRASGSFQVDVVVESIDGALPVDTGRITVRSTAISGLGLVLSIGAGLFLAAWWASHFRKVRRARGLVDEPRSEHEA